MEELLRKNDKILITGGSCLAGNLILNSLKKTGYGQKEIGGEFLRPSRKELNKKKVLFWGSGTGTQKRELLHSNNLGDACVFVLENCYRINESAPKNKEGTLLNMLNVGIGIDISIKELRKKIADIVNFRGEIIWDTSKPNGLSRKVLDVSRLNALEWNH